MNRHRKAGAWAGTLLLVATATWGQTAAKPAATATAVDKTSAAKIAAQQQVPVAQQPADAKRIAVEKKVAAERFAVERATLVQSPVFKAAKQWTPAVADDAAARLAKVAEICPTCRLIRPAEAVPLGDLGGGAAPPSAGGGQPVVWLADASPALRERIGVTCPECVQVLHPTCLPGAGGGGTVVFSMVDPGGWNPGDEGDLCTVPPMVMFSAGALDSQIRAALARGGANVTVADYEAAAPQGCPRQTLVYQLSVASQLLGGGDQ